jgi:hypothetical protein
MIAAAGIFRRILGTGFFSGQTDSAVGIFMNIPAPLHLSRKLYQRAPPGMAQTKRRCDFAKTLGLSRAGKMREDVGFSNGRVGIIVARHEQPLYAL